MVCYETFIFIFVRGHGQECGGRHLSLACFLISENLQPDEADGQGGDSTDSSTRQGGLSADPTQKNVFIFICLKSEKKSHCKHNEYVIVIPARIIFIFIQTQP